MTNKEKEYIRCMIARASCVPPDDVKILTDGMPVLYAIEDFCGFNVVVGFESFPTFDEVDREVFEMFLISMDIVTEAIKDII